MGLSLLYFLLLGSTISLLSHSSHVWLFVTLWALAIRLLCPWVFLGRNTGMGCHALLQGIFPTQGSNLVSCFSCIAGRSLLVLNTATSNLGTLPNSPWICLLLGVTLCSSLMNSNCSHLYQPFKVVPYFPLWIWKYPI